MEDQCNVAYLNFDGEKLIPCGERSRGKFLLKFDVKRENYTAVRHFIMDLCGEDETALSDLIVEKR